MRPSGYAIGEGMGSQFLRYPTGPKITRAATSPDRHAPPVCESCECRATRSEAYSCAKEDGIRPARTVVVDVLQSLFDKPVYVGHLADILDLQLAHHFDRPEADEEANS